MKSITTPLQRSIVGVVILSFLLGLSILLESCGTTCETTRTYVYYEPVYTGLDEIRSQVVVGPSREITSLGRIYLKDDFLFLNEPGEGIHVIDNHNPASPQPVSFITIPGNYDLAIKGNYLYADSFIDLLVFDISNKSDIKKMHIVENAFSSYSSLGFYADEFANVITTWEYKESIEMEVSECDQVTEPWGGVRWRNGVIFETMAAADFSAKAAVAPNNGAGTGVAGSTARFAISKDHLYMLDGGYVNVMGLSNAALPEQGTKVYVAWDSETIFPYKDYLFLGARSGMHIVDVSSPSDPKFTSTYSHVNSCDPVVVDDKYAYVTLRSGNPTCEGFANQLEVIDVSNVTSPTLVATHTMHNPHGLGKDEDLLFICDGDAGLKVFDASNVNTIGSNLVARHEGIHAYDVIPLDGVLMMIGEDGLIQYEYTSPGQLKFLSKLPVVQ